MSHQVILVSVTYPPLPDIRRVTITGLGPPGVGIPGTDGDEIRSLRRINGDTYTLTQSDAGGYVRIASEDPVSAHIELDGEDPIPIYSVFTLRQASTGVITVVAAEGVTLNGAPQTAGQHRSIQLVKIDANEWDIEGGVDADD